MYAYSEPSPFPPSFEGNPYSYALGLFGDVVAAALALALLAAIVLEPRRNKEIAKRLRSPVMLPVLAPRWSPLFLYRGFVIQMLVFVIMRSLPDALWMILWGEVREATIRVLLKIDLWCDGLALVPLGGAIIFWAWGRQVIPQRLTAELSARVLGRPSWGLVWQNARIAVVVLMIAAGVSFGKAHGS